MAKTNFAALNKEFHKGLLKCFDFMKENPLFVLNEDDFKCFLYSELKERAVFWRPLSTENDGEKIPLLHAEYWHSNADKFKSTVSGEEHKGKGFGSYDLAILNPMSLGKNVVESHEISKNSTLGRRGVKNRKEVLIGCELKWRRNSYPEYIEYFLEEDIATFLPDTKTSYFSRYGYVVYVHYCDLPLYKHDKKTIDEIKRFTRKIMAQYQFRKRGQVVKAYLFQIIKADRIKTELHELM